jgi:hypothetical protein
VIASLAAGAIGAMIVYVTTSPPATAPQAQRRQH